MYANTCRIKFSDNKTATQFADPPQSCPDKSNIQSDYSEGMKDNFFGGDQN